MAEGLADRTRIWPTSTATPPLSACPKALAFIEAMNQTFAQQLVLATSTNPDGVLGAARAITACRPPTPRTSSTPAAPARTTSVWLIVWGENTVTGIYPKGSGSRPAAARSGRDRRVRQRAPTTASCLRQAVEVEVRRARERLALCGAGYPASTCPNCQPDGHPSHHRRDLA